MKKLLLLFTAASMSLAVSTAAQADLVLSDLVFRDLGGTGFGVAPRLLSLQNTPFEAGGTVVLPGGVTGFTTGASQTFCGSGNQNSCPTGEPLTQQSNVFNVAALGWLTGFSVGIGLDTNEIGATAGLTFQSLELTLYDINGNELGSFAGDGPVFISQALLALQQGNGNSVFDIRLSVDQQAEYDAILAAAGGPQNVWQGLSASFGCTTPAIGCGPSTDGAESFLAFVVPGPIVGAGLPGLLLAFGGAGMFGLNRFRRKRAGLLPA